MSPARCPLRHSALSITELVDADNYIRKVSTQPCAFGTSSTLQTLNPCLRSLLAPSPSLSLSPPSILSRASLPPAILIRRGPASIRSPLHNNNPSPPKFADAKATQPRRGRSTHACLHPSSTRKYSLHPSARSPRPLPPPPIREMPTTTITLPRPDDFHHHLRDGNVLGDTVAACANQFGRAICMPNLVPPVTTAEQASAYKLRIMEALRARCGEGSTFQPLMTLYLTDSTTPEMIKAAAATGDVKAVKLYPAGATTNSASGGACTRPCRPSHVTTSPTHPFRVDHPTHQPTHSVWTTQPINPPTHQPTHPSTHPPINPPTHQPTYPSIRPPNPPTQPAHPTHPLRVTSPLPPSRPPHHLTQ